MTYLLDTNVISEAVQNRPSEAVQNWLHNQRPEVLHISAITLGELTRGIKALPAGSRRERLEVWCGSIVGEFEPRTLPIDTAVALRWGELFAEAQANGSTLPMANSLIAATALVHDLTIVTRNVVDFERCGVPVLNPWTAG